jgi:hypothetical protein
LTETSLTKSWFSEWTRLLTYSTMLTKGRCCTWRRG